MTATADSIDRVLASVPRGLWVDGEERAPQGAEASNHSFGVLDPSTGRELGRVADGGPADAVAALDAASRAQSDWERTSPRVRGEILRRAFEEMTARTEELALLVTLEMGKPLAESRAEVAYAAEFFRWFSEEAVRIGGEYRNAPGGDFRILTHKRAVGPCLLITPWNFPLAMVTRKLGAAVAAGCTTVLKPAEETPLSALALAALLRDVGLPPGVFNVVPTSRPAETTAPLYSDRRLRKLSFTGSTEVGRLLLKAAADSILRTSMELGGNAPFLVLSDADLDAAVEGAMLAKLRNMGQSCVAANRFLVHRSLADDLAARLAARFQELQVGPGIDPGSDIGPLIDEAGRSKVTDLVRRTLDTNDAARVLVGGEVPAGEGFFYPPTVVTGVAPNSPLAQEEVFGPVAAIQSYDDDDELLHAANATPFGLVAYVYTHDLRKALRVVEQLEAGMVGVNRGLVSNPAAPFGGVKWSGLGREGGFEGVEEYLATTYAALSV
ncbi:MAG: NAD-dependent succinate-semialdehyde dehydrogenase [Actinomycetes bacterium]